MHVYSIHFKGTQDAGMGYIGYLQEDLGGLVGGLGMSGGGV